MFEPMACFRKLTLRTLNSSPLQMICLRSIPAIDAASLAPFEAKEALFRDEQGFLLYLNKLSPSEPTEERIVRLGAREALLWLNEPPDNRGSFWG
jgi:hypothetical protein